MQPCTKTFVRQKTVVRPAPSSNVATDKASYPASPSPSRASTKEALRFAIHLQFCCPPAKTQHDDHQVGFDGSESRRFRGGHTESKKGKSAKSPKIFLHKTIRLVFGARALDSGEKLVDHVETPGQGAQRYLHLQWSRRGMGAAPTRYQSSRDAAQNLFLYELYATSPPGASTMRLPEVASASTFMVRLHMLRGPHLKRKRSTMSCHSIPIPMANGARRKLVRSASSSARGHASSSSSTWSFSSHESSAHRPQLGLSWARPAQQHWHPATWQDLPVPKLRTRSIR